MQNETFTIETAHESETPAKGRQKSELRKALDLLKVGQVLRYRGNKSRENVYAVSQGVKAKFSFRKVEGGFDCFRIA